MSIKSKIYLSMISTVMLIIADGAFADAIKCFSSQKST